MDVKDIGTMVLTMAIAGIIISFTLLVQSELGTEIENQAGTNSYAANASTEAIKGVAEFSGWFVIIALAIVFAVILGIIVKYIGGAGRR